MDVRTKIGVISASEYAIESQAVQLALNTEGTFEVVATTSKSNFSPAPTHSVRTYRDGADFVRGEANIRVDSGLGLLCFVCPGAEDWAHIVECLCMNYEVLCVDPILPWSIAEFEHIFLSAAAKNKFILGFPITCFPMLREVGAVIGDGSTGDMANIDPVLQLSPHGGRTPVRRIISAIPVSFKPSEQWM
jgi:hypothetical protein